MAVYTKITYKDLKKFVSQYNIGEVLSFQPIQEGIENTNYKITTSTALFILTIFERKTVEKNIIFYFKLMLFLKRNAIKCPIPIENKNGEYFSYIYNKPAAILTFLKGTPAVNPSEEHCKQCGLYLANIHNLSKKFTYRRNTLTNYYNPDYLAKLIGENKAVLKNILGNKYSNFFSITNKVINKIPKNLPFGIIHGDLFPDNMFFIKKKVSAIIDFYFASYYFFIYDIAILINSWCFNSNGEYLEKNASSIIKAYNSVRKLSQNEMYFLNIFCVICAIRFFITRSVDFKKDLTKSLVTKKNPYEYYNKIVFFNNKI